MSKLPKRPAVKWHGDVRIDTVRRATVWGTPGLLSELPSLIGVQKIGGYSRQWDIHQGTKPAYIANRYRCGATVPSQDTELF